MPAHRDRALALALGLTLLTLYLLTSAFRFRTIDEVAVFALSRGIAGRGAFDGDVLYWTGSALGEAAMVATGTEGTIFTVKDVGPSLLAAPFLIIARLADLSQTRIILLFSPLVTTLTGALTLIFARRWGAGRRSALLIALTFGIGSLAWPYAETLFTQPTAALGLLLALAGTLEARRTGSVRFAALAACGIGLAGLSATPTWISGVVYGLALLPVTWERPFRLDRGRLPTFLAFGVTAATFIGLWGGYNLARFGAFFETGHRQLNALKTGLTYTPQALFGLLLSTPRGLLWYAPFVALIPASVWLGWKTHRPLLLIALGQCLTITAFYSTYEGWDGGLAWGPRFLVPLMPALALTLIPLLEKVFSPEGGVWGRGVVITALALSALTAGIGSTLRYTDFELDFIKDRTPLRLESQSLANHLPMLTDPRYLPLVRIFDPDRPPQPDLLALRDGDRKPALLAVGFIALLINAALMGIMLTGTEETPPSPLSEIGEGTGVGWKLISLGVTAFALIFTTLAHPPLTEEIPALDTFTEKVEQQADRNDGLILILQDRTFPWLEAVDGRWHEYGMTYEDPLSPESTALLERASDSHDRLWLITEGSLPGDPANGVGRWLGEQGAVGEAISLEDLIAVPYTFPGADAETIRLDATFGGNIRLDCAVFYQQDGSVSVILGWSGVRAIETDYKVFVHLLAADGFLLAQHDGSPQGGYAPASSWIPGQTVSDGHSLSLPPDLPPGRYQLVVGLYDPLSGERLAVNGGGDSVFVREVIVGSDPD